VDSALDSLRGVWPAGQVSFAPGYDLVDADSSRAEALADEAVAAASLADVVVAFLGLPAAEESEGFDRSHMDLPVAQTSLLERLLDGPAPVVVVLANGSAVLVSPWHSRAAAIVECWLGGQAVGGAIADVLTGAVNPSGRLTETIPLRLQDNSSYLNFPGEDGHVRYGEGIFVGYRGYDACGLDVAFPFGHGLSYTTFSYADPVVSVTGSHDGGDLAIAVRVTVTNTGDVAGREVVQLYVGSTGTSRGRVARPPRELKGFVNVALEPGESAAVLFTLGSRDLAFWSTKHGRWVVAGGEYAISVGASSRDIRLAVPVDVAATPPRLRLDGMATLEEWLSDPDGRAAIMAVLGAAADGQVNGVLGSEELLRLIGNFPLATLAALPGLGMPPGLVDDLTRRVGGS
jgi:beta-glucosidase